MMAAMKHKGFAFVDIIQPCITFDDTREAYKQRTYWLEDGFPTADRATAIAKVTENNGKVPLGIFYKADAPTFEDSLRT
jgi:2-oxoglutarate ferredoxin oxidoreductase subunit beta